MKTILLALLLLLAACDEVILHDLPEFQANKVIVTLANKDVKANKLRTAAGWDVVVDEQDVAKALAQIESSRVLRQEIRDIQKRQQPLILSKEERSHYLERQIAETLQATLERLPHILEARVHLSVDSVDMSQWEVKKTNNSASVLLISDKPSAIDKNSVSQLVSGAAGLKAEEISVLISPNENVPSSKAKVITVPAKASKEKQPATEVTAENISFSRQDITMAGLGGVILLLAALLLKKNKSKTPIRPAAPVNPASNGMSMLQPPTASNGTHSQQTEAF